MKIIYVIAVLLILGMGFGLEQNAYAAEKFVTNQTVTYQVVKWINDDHITNQNLTDILDEAILVWETLNPGLKFEKTKSNPDVVIRWGNLQNLGIAICENECMRSNTIDYTVRLSIGLENCLGEFTYMSRDYIKNTTIHELGHTLGITHTWDRNNIMYGQVIYDGGYLKPVGFLEYNIPNSTNDYYEGEEEAWNDLLNITQSIKSLNETASIYENNLDIMEANEAGFKIKFEENRLDTRDVLTEMTIPIASRMADLESSLVVLQAESDDLNKNYEMHTNLYNIWKTKVVLVNAEIVELEKQLDDTVGFLTCLPLTMEAGIMEWIEQIKNI